MPVAGSLSTGLLSGTQPILRSGCMATRPTLCVHTDGTNFDEDKRNAGYDVVMPSSSTRASMPRLSFIGLIWILAVDLMVRVEIGPISVSGLATLATATVCVVLVPMVTLVGRKRKQGNVGRTAGKIPWPLTAFGFFVLVRLLAEPSSEGLQNVAVYLCFIAGAAVVALKAPLPSVDKMLKFYGRAALLVTFIFLGALALGVEVYGERAFALSTLVFLAVLIPNRSRKLISRLAPFIVTAAAFLSLSRTAAVIGAGLLVFLALRNRRRVRLPIAVLVSAAAASTIFWAITSYAPFRSRFLGGDAAIEIGGLSFNTSGRANLWNATIESAMTNPWFGNGAGTAAEMIQTKFITISHPHNEYLRIFHDFGWIGITLFSLGSIMLVARVWQRARRTDHPVHWTALIGLLGILASSITDNVLTYPFVVFPLAVLVGASLAQPLPCKSKMDRTRGTRMFA